MDAPVASVWFVVVVLAGCATPVEDGAGPCPDTLGGPGDAAGPAEPCAGQGLSGSGETPASTPRASTPGTPLPTFTDPSYERVCDRHHLVAMWHDPQVFTALAGQAPNGVRPHATIPNGVPVQMPHGTAYAYLLVGTQGNASVTFRPDPEPAFVAVIQGEAAPARNDVRSLVVDAVGEVDGVDALVDRLVATYGWQPWNGSQRLEALYEDGDDAWAWSFLEAARSWLGAAGSVTAFSLGNVSVTMTAESGREPPDEEDVRGLLAGWGLPAPVAMETTLGVQCRS